MTSFLLSQLFLVCCWTHVGWTCVHMCLWNVRGYDVETWSLPEAGAWQFHLMLMAVLFWSLRSEHWDTGRPSCLAWHLCGYRGAESYCLCCIANVYPWDFYPSHSDCSNTVVTRRKGHLLPITVTVLTCCDQEKRVPLCTKSHRTSGCHRCTPSFSSSALHLKRSVCFGFGGCYMNKR